MEKKVYTVQLDKKSLETTASKSAKVQVSKAQKEVEKFGVVEINNKSSKCKVKKTTDLGYEKNVVSTAKKSIKSNLAQVDDYFDFSFRPTETRKAKVEAVAQNETKIVSDAQICGTYILNEEAKKVISIARAGSLFG
ncbi:MAG: hypothetical protein IJA23_00320 [Clostridia bacterium]|nr:hypothetical protein [Clostridia bacterium]